MNIKKSGFTLLELIVVIVIIGVLATLGFTQYTKVIEKQRCAEARTNLGFMRKLAYDYYLKNRTFTGIVNSDVGIGVGLPSSCDPRFYFWYTLGSFTETRVDLAAVRCGSGGKPPQAQGAVSWQTYIRVDVNSGDTWICQNPGECPW